MNDEKQDNGKQASVTNNYAVIWNYNAHIEHQHNYYGKEKKDEKETVPIKDQMKMAVAETLKQGFWWSNRSWAVVYRIYQIKGYKNSISQFVQEVEDWHLETTYSCNYDAVQKPLASGMYAGKPDSWEANGVQRQAVMLAKALLAEMDKAAETTNNKPV